MFKEIVFWQDIPSAHLNHFICEIPNLNLSLSTTLVVNNYYSDNRKQMGWDFQEEYPNIKTIINPSLADTISLLENQNSIHILSGFRHFPKSHIVLKYLNEKKIYGGFLMERPDFWKLKGMLRKWATPFFEKCYSKESKFVFTFGTEAIEWYSKSGFSTEQVFPFLYTVPILYDKPTINYFKPSSNSLDIAFVGSLTKLKGIDTFLSALSELDSAHELNIHIFGDGPFKDKIIEVSKKINNSINIHIYGFKPNQEVRHALQYIDVLILPSHYDGWGAVINESLMAGTPVICSDACGASQLITNYSNGVIFPKGNHKKLQEALEYYLEKGKISNYEKIKIKNWAENNISPLKACEYFLSKLKLIETNLKNNNYDLPWEPFKLD